MAVPESAPVGVVIPTHNRLPYLKQALASVLEQTHGELRVVVVDDASPDQTARFLEGERDPRVSFTVNERNLGLAGSVNRGISLLPPEVAWCTVLCDDDLLDPGYLATMVDAVSRRGIRDVAYGRIRLIDGEGAFVRDAAFPPERESALEYQVSRRAGERETYLSGALFSREAFQRVGGYPVFRTGMAADDALLFALALGSGLSYVAGARVLIRVHGAAESQQVTGIPAHLQAVREFGAFCRSQAQELGGVAAGELDRAITARMRALNELLWLRGERFLRKNRRASGESREELATLYRMARSGEWEFPRRIRLDGWIRLLSGISPESVGFYRYFWERVLGVAPGR